MEIIGGTGYAGGAIRDEALERGHSVIAVSRSAPAPGGAGRGAGAPGELRVQRGNLHDPELGQALADEADVIVVAIPGREIDGRKLLDSLKPLTDAAARAGTRLGFVGGAGSLQVTEGGLPLVDTPEFPEAHKNEALSHADVLYALQETGDDVDWFYVSPAGRVVPAGVIPAELAYRAGLRVACVRHLRPGVPDLHRRSGRAGADLLRTTRARAGASSPTSSRAPSPPG